ncbi:MAG: FAD-dependent oxidoreductase [Alphaproteobacteria bacterium]|nr:FAD-dependent oxidoreductase [Alphaproteobacteria bacterium]
MMTTNLSYWEKDVYVNNLDVVIVGIGFVGLWTALALKNKHPKLKILMVDQGVVPTGASTKNAGFACFGSITEQLENLKTLGEEKTLEFVKNRYQGIETIKKTFNPKQIDYFNYGGYEIILNDHSQNRNWLQEVTTINSLLSQVLPLKNTYQLKNSKIKQFGFKNVNQLVFTPSEGQLHSGKLLLALKNKVENLGVLCLQNISVDHVVSKRQAVDLCLKNGGILKAAHVVICTNAFTKSLFPKIDVIPARGQILLTEPIPNLKLKGCFHAEAGYYYFRNLDNRILLGGARHKSFTSETTTTIETTTFIQNDLKKFLYDIIIPDLKFKPKIHQSWAGIMAMGSEKTPLIQEIKPRVYTAVRMSGMGVALAPVVGEKIANMFF